MLEVTEVLTEMKVAQARNYEKLCAIEYLLKEHIAQDEKTFDDLEKRMRASERRHWYTGGVTAVLAVIGTLVARNFLG
jgi:hypothetical protein